MSKRYYKHTGASQKKKFTRLLGLLLILTGVLITGYVFLPLISWQIYFAPVFASQNIASPIPQTTIVSNTTFQTLLAQASNSLSGIDYNNADNWFPNFKHQRNGVPEIQTYSLSIPKLNIKNAVVSTVDTDLSKHLINYDGTAVPAGKGNAVVFGHSTLPQLYDAKNYKTVFTYLYELTPGDEIVVNVGNVIYKYRVENITVVDPNNTSILQQNFDDSYLTLVTCTPPGTIWKRLAVKARIEKI
ncbi:MAG TPA: sortase [Patescibacteria group bacterium]|jgi:sortase A|nr:sortase [Patescibacteria group bacterium]